ncbi:hypothetical protein F5Y09DRAFT_295453 [Xylaria sp. FL1042]|nr:hypothetical protein F5Y09DRAFT_295453 [Xylaria sp. FL1042]
MHFLRVTARNTYQIPKKYSRLLSESFATSVGLSRLGIRYHTVKQREGATNNVRQDKESGEYTSEEAFESAVSSESTPLKRGPDRFAFDMEKARVRAKVLKGEAESRRSLLTALEKSLGVRIIEGEEATETRHEKKIKSKQLKAAWKEYKRYIKSKEAKAEASMKPEVPEEVPHDEDEEEEQEKGPAQTIVPGELRRRERRRLEMIEKQRERIRRSKCIPKGSQERKDEIQQALDMWIEKFDAKASARRRKKGLKRGHYMVRQKNKARKKEARMLGLSETDI